MEIEKTEVNSDTSHLPVYSGMGIVDKQGVARYYASLPLKAKGKIKWLETYDLGHAIVVRISNEPENVPYENPNHDVVELTSPGKIMAGGRERTDLFLWHDEKSLGSIEAAREVLSKCTKKDLPASEPAKCGKGVLTFDL